MNLRFKMNCFRLSSINKICNIKIVFLLLISIVFFVFILFISLFTEWKVSFFICLLAQQIFIFCTFLLNIILIILMIIVNLNISAIFKLPRSLIKFINIIMVFRWNKMLVKETFTLCILICLISISSFWSRFLWKLRRSNRNFIFLCRKLTLFKH